MTTIRLQNHLRARLGSLAKYPETPASPVPRCGGRVGVQVARGVRLRQNTASGQYWDVNATGCDEVLCWW
jgi:hypothetical protein